MFGQKWKRPATQIFDFLNGTFTLAFAGSRYINDANGKLSFPFGFLDDDYILGFIHGFIGFSLANVFGGQRLSPTNRGKVVFAVWESVGGAQGIRVCRQLTAQVESEFERLPKSFVAGYDHALIYVGTHFGIATLKEAYDPNFYSECYKLAKALHEEAVELGTAGSGETSNSSLAAAILMLTLRSHLSEHYF